ncbi:MinD/ParA family ATP-binding protein [Actinomadura violacea]|uniref:MinD/ParA family ATP-binding protein n=1 Tax=Actinomadura violacea TaxID=2819934 RepID=UPI0027DC8D16|nr:AAA family ATPase [Actinomadura violacea]
MARNEHDGRSLEERLASLDAMSGEATGPSDPAPPAATEGEQPAGQPPGQAVQAGQQPQGADQQAAPPQGAPAEPGQPPQHDPNANPWLAAPPLQPPENFGPDFGPESFGPPPPVPGAAQNLPPYNGEPMPQPFDGGMLPPPYAAGYQPFEPQQPWETGPPQPYDAGGQGAPPLDQLPPYMPDQPFPPPMDPNAGSPQPFPGDPNGAQTFPQDPNAQSFAPDPNAQPFPQDPNAQSFAPDPNAQPFGQDPNAQSFAPDPNAQPFGQDPNAQAFPQDPNAQSFAPDPAAQSFGQEPNASAQPYAADPNAGQPYAQNAGGQPYPVDPNTGQPYLVDPNTGQPYAVDPATGQSYFVDPNTGRPLQGYAYPQQGQPAQPGAYQQVPPGQQPYPGQQPQQQQGDPNDTDSLSSENLLGERRIAPSSGWRRAVYKATGGSVHPGESQGEMRRKDLIARARTAVAGGHHRVAVMSLKGGVGKTTTTTGLGSMLGSIRGDTVIAVDANPDRGTLSDKVRLETAATVRDLLNGRDKIQRYADVRAFTSQNAARLEVLASDRDPAVSEAFSAEDYEAVAAVLEQYYSICITDCGTGLLHSAMAGVLKLADQLVLVSSPSVDGARSASATLDWLEAHDHGHLVRNGVVVLSMVRNRTRSQVDLDKLQAHFESRCRAVVRIPYDDHLEEGAEVELEQLAQTTREAYLTLAAVVGDGFAYPRPDRTS